MLDLSKVNISEYVTNKEAFDAWLKYLSHWNDKYEIEVWVSAPNMERYKEALEEEFGDDIERIIKVGGERVDIFRFKASSISEAKAFAEYYNPKISIDKIGDELIVKDYNHVTIRLFHVSSRRILSERKCNLIDGEFIPASYEM